MLLVPCSSQLTLCALASLLTCLLQVISLRTGNKGRVPPSYLKKVCCDACRAMNCCCHSLCVYPSTAGMCGDVHYSRERTSEHTPHSPHAPPTQHGQPNFASPTHMLHPQPHPHVSTPLASPLAGHEAPTVRVCGTSPGMWVGCHACRLSNSSTTRLTGSSSYVRATRDTVALQSHSGILCCVWVCQCGCVSVGVSTTTGGSRCLDTSRYKRTRQTSGCLCRMPRTSTQSL